MSIYDFTVKTRDGKDVKLSDYSGKLLLIVNTATGCGFTPQYEALEDLYKEFKDEGFEILDFPCNQFGGQAPGSAEQIYSFCTVNFGISFEQFAKINVLGPNADPLFKYLCENAPFEGFGNSPVGCMMAQELGCPSNDDPNKNDIKWNFTKFLIGRDGEIIKRFESPVEPGDIADVIEEVI